MDAKLEKIANSLKGIASILSTMSEVPRGSITWNEWALHLLYEELDEDIRTLEAIANCKGDEGNEDKE